MLQAMLLVLVPCIARDSRRTIVHKDLTALEVESKWYKLA